MRFLRVLVALGLVLAGGCTDAPAPEPTARPTSAPAPSRPPDPISAPAVGVVVAPQPDRSVVRERLQELAGRRDEVQWEIAEATTNDAVAELVGRFVDRGLDMVCVVGPGQADRVATIAGQVPRGRFCVGPATLPESPAPNVLYVDLRIEETAYLAGAVAGLVDPRGQAGIITTRATYGAAREQASFAKGVGAAGAATRELAVAGPVADDDAARSAIEEQFDGGVGVVFAGTGLFDETLVEVALARTEQRAAAAAAAAAETAAAATEAATEVETEGETATEEPVDVVPTGLILRDGGGADSSLQDVVLAIVRHFPERVVLPAIDRLLSTWEPGQSSVGLTEDAVSIDLAATPLAAPHVDTLNRLRGEIAVGDRDPTQE